MIDTLRTLDGGKGKIGFYYSLPALEEKGLGKISRLPVSIRIVLESVLRNCDGKKVAEKDVETLAAWNAKTPAQEEIPFVVARIVLQDFTGVPLLVDLAAMRTAVATLKKDPKIIEPLVPVDLVVDHSVQVDFFGSPDALRLPAQTSFHFRGRTALGSAEFKKMQARSPGFNASRASLTSSPTCSTAQMSELRGGTGIKNMSLTISAARRLPVAGSIATPWHDRRARPARPAVPRRCRTEARSANTSRSPGESNCATRHLNGPQIDGTRNIRAS